MAKGDREPGALRVGLIGCGHIGTVHAYALRRLAAARLVDARLGAVYDVDGARAESLARNLGGYAVASPGELVDAADVVWIATWTAQHEQAVTEAVAAGKPVFCEKPLAPTYEACERVAAQLERVPHRVGLVLRSSPVLAHLVALVSERRYGDVLAVALRDDQYFPIQGMYGSTWRGDVAQSGGGTLIEHSIHDVDLMRWLLGDPSEIAARTACRFGHAGIDDVAFVQATLAGGTLWSLTSVWHQVLTRGSSRRLEVFCTDAYLWLDDEIAGPLHVETSAGAEGIVAAYPDWLGELALPDVYEKALAPYAVQAKTFLDAIAAGTADPGPGAREALAAHRLVEHAYRSAARGGVPQALRS